MRNDRLHQPALMPHLLAAAEIEALVYDPAAFDDLAARLRAAKGPVQAPKSVDFVEAIPLTPVGKPDKKAVRARYWAGSDRSVG